MNLPISIAQALRAAADPAKVAIKQADRSITHGELVTRMDKVSSAGASALGLTAGDAVMLIAPNILEYIEIFAGLAQLGVLTATLTPRLSEAEVKAIAADCNAKAIIAHIDSAQSAKAAGLPLVTVGDGGDYEAWLAAAPPPPPEGFPTPDPELPVAAPYTSGSTGQPKGVLLSQRSRLALIDASVVTYGCFEADDVFYSVSPMCYGGGLLYALAALVRGGSIIVAPKFDPEATAMAMAGGEVTGIFLVPTHFFQMLALPEEILSRQKPRGALRTIISNAAPLTDELRYRILDYWGEGLLHETYGSTEAGVTTDLAPADQRRKKKCVGTPVPGIELRIVDGEGKDVADGEIGELMIRSPWKFNGYMNRPAETAEVMRGDWVVVGDLARRDDEGYYYIAGRSKDMIISGAINIYPKEIEDVLTTHPAVAEASVVGFEDPQWGESVGAAIVLHAGRAVEEGELAAHVRASLAGFKVPRRVMILDALPRSAMGKIQKIEIRKLMNGETS